MLIYMLYTNRINYLIRYTLYLLSTITINFININKSHEETCKPTVNVYRYNQHTLVDIYAVQIFVSHFKLLHNILYERHVEMLLLSVVILM